MKEQLPNFIPCRVLYFTIIKIKCMHCTKKKTAITLLFSLMCMELISVGWDLKLTCGLKTYTWSLYTTCISLKVDVSSFLHGRSRLQMQTFQEAELFFFYYSLTKITKSTMSQDHLYSKTKTHRHHLSIERMSMLHCEKNA